MDVCGDSVTVTAGPDVMTDAEEPILLAGNSGSSCPRRGELHPAPSRAIIHLGGELGEHAALLERRLDRRIDVAEHILIVGFGRA